MLVLVIPPLRGEVDTLLLLLLLCDGTTTTSSRNQNQSQNQTRNEIVKSIRSLFLSCYSRRLALLLRIISIDRRLNRRRKVKNK